MHPYMLDHLTRERMLDRRRAAETDALVRRHRPRRGWLTNLFAGLARPCRTSVRSRRVRSSARRGPPGARSPVRRTDARAERARGRDRTWHARAMELRSIGSLKVSAVGIGCNNFGMRIDEEQTGAVVRAALDAGVNLFDTADVYGGTRSEEFLGRALAGRRDEAIIATKFGAQIDDDRKGASGRTSQRAVDDSLRRLGTDRIDLYQLHVPDAATPIEETLGALDELVRAGKVREIGASNFTAEMIDEAEGVSRAHEWARFVSVQNEYSLLRRLPERGVLDACVRNDIGFLPYFPLASGMLTGKYRRNEAPPAGHPPREHADRARSSRPSPRRTSTASRRSKRGPTRRGHTLLELAFSLAARARPAVVERDRRRDEARAGSRRTSRPQAGP